MDTGRIAGRAGVLEKDLENPAMPTKFSTWKPPSHAEGTYPQNCMIEVPRNQISELLSINSLILRTSSVLGDEFQDRSVLLFRLSYARHVVDQRCRGGQISGRSCDVAIKKRLVFPNFEMLDAKIASALKSIISEQYCRRRINVEQPKPKHKTEFFEEDTLLT